MSPKPEAASSAAFFDSPNDFAAVSDHLSILSADLPKMTPALLVVSARSDADEMPSTAN